MEVKQLTDSEKLDILSKRMKRIETSTHIHTIVVIIGFLGVISLGSLIQNLKSKIK